MRKIQWIIMVAAISAALMGTAIAQDQPPQSNWWPGWMMTWGQRGIMGPGGMGPWMMGGSPRGMCNAMVSHIEGRLAYIKAELKITEAQESLWNAYAAAAHDNANSMASHCTSMIGGASTVSLPDRLDQHEQFMVAQLNVVRAMNKALKPLYAALSDSQKKIADQLFWSPMGMM